ncbi:NB-ARC domain containing protein [Trema orientale]|uniref:NB-ARC domain containing protein n=1 Tax=Trema orientale TaxID=63057 RepID=A0A2P5FLK5_TREOI|nr:NB-ARC domain containing protein [Trema orientale]
MAELVLTKLGEAVVSHAVQRVSELLIHEATSLITVKDDVERLQAELRRMQCFLKDADRKQEQDERVRNWIAEVRDVAYDVEDVVETFIIKVDSSFIKVIHLRRIRNRISFIQARIKDIFESRLNYGIEFAGREQGSSFPEAEQQRNSRRSCPYDDDDDDDDDGVISLERCVTALEAQLLKEEDRVCVVSIVGMGGLGKTTLAKKVFNHRKVRQHFDCFVWVFVSQQYVPKDVLCEILVQVKGIQSHCAGGNSEKSRQRRDLLEETNSEKSILQKFEEHELINLIKDELEKKRYLVVLDDIWRIDAWNRIKGAFLKGKKGSKVVFTTRIKEVAFSADPYVAPIEPPFLTLEESWELLRRKAFPRDIFGERGCPPNYEKLGKEMIKKCGGLPLAIVVLGGLLRTKNLLDGWKKVERDVSLHFNNFKSQQQYGVEEILALSYHDLPYYLKPCFLYLGGFPEDWEIPSRKLIRLWIAEGFIPTPRTGEMDETMEDIAEQYLQELIDRCMLQVGKRDHTGAGVKTCRMHDLMRDFCVSKVREENFFEIIEQHQMNMANPGSSVQGLASTRSRRIAVYLDRDRDLDRGAPWPWMDQVCPHLRSLLCFDVGDFFLPLSNKNFRLVRVLELWFVRPSDKFEVPGEIGNLIHLRYLGFRGAGMSTYLPRSIGKLRNLHTLDLRENYITSLPKAISRLTRLRHLLLPSHWVDDSTIFKCSKCHFRMDNLRNIETLKYIVDETLIRYDAVSKLTNLRKLGICFQSDKEVRTVLESFTPAQLGRLRSLTMIMQPKDHSFPSLKLLSGCHALSKLSLYGKLPEDSYGTLRFLPVSLTKLVLARSEIKRDPMTVLEKLPDLRFLQLGKQSYVGNEMVCSADGFPRLETLQLFSLSQVEQSWRVAKGALPSLKRLDIKWIPKLRTIPEDLKFFAKIRELNITREHSSFKDDEAEQGKDPPETSERPHTYWQSHIESSERGEATRLWSRANPSRINT